VIRDKLLSTLRGYPQGLPSTALAEQVDVICRAESVAAIEAILLLSPEVRRDGGRWKLSAESRTMRILSAIDAYADASGRRIFRAASALANLPPSEHPTEAELATVIASSGGRYEFMPNGMIKRIQ